MRALHRCSTISAIFSIVTILIFSTPQAQTTPSGGPDGPPDATSSDTWASLPSGTSAMLWDVFGGASYTLAVGANGTLLRYDGFDWETLFTPTTLPLHALWGAAPNEIFMVGASGRIFTYDGETVRQMPYVTAANLRGVWGRGTSDVFAVGDNGTTLRYDGGEWRILLSGTASRLWDVHGAAAAPVFAVGNNATIIRYDDGAWRLETTPTTRNLNGVWVRSEDDAFAVGDAGTILRYDGDSWQLMETPTTANLNDVWGISQSQVFAVGDNGLLLYFDGSKWTYRHLATTAMLKGIHNGFVVGANGTIRVNPTLFIETDGLRISEIDPVTGRVEVTNTGPAFTTGTHPFCHLLDYESAIPAGTTFGAGEIELFPVSGLSRDDSDLWLYRTFPFDDPNNMIHGVKYGPRPDVGQTGVAVEAGRWTSTTVFAPAPPSGTTLAYDGFGFDPKDWYVDETPSLGYPDATTPAVIPSALNDLVGEQDAGNNRFVLTATEDFEDMLLGDEVIAIDGWSIDNTSPTNGIFTTRAVEDVMGAVERRASSSRWLRIRDQEGKAERNNVVAPTIAAPGGEIAGYAWKFWVNIEEKPGPGYPRFMIQHEDGVFENAWGVEFRPDALCLVVTDFGGGEAAECIIGPSPPPGAWTQLAIEADFTIGMIELFVNEELSGVLPIDLPDTAQETVFRFAYHGTGVGNTGTTLLDDVTVDLIPFAQPFFAAVSASANSDDVSLTWRVLADEPRGGFIIYRQSDGAPEREVAGPLPSDARHFVDAALASGRVYRYVVGAVLDNGDVIRSQPAHIRVDALPVVLFKDIHAVHRGEALEIAWDLDVNEPIAGFRLYRWSSHSADEVDITGGVLLPGDARWYRDASIRPGQWYAHVVAAVTPDGKEIRSGQSFVAIPAPPLEITRLFPNPFAGSTSLDFSLSTASRVTVNVYDVQGKYVATITDEVYREGPQTITWNGRDARGHAVSAGTYFFKLETRGSVLTRKVVLVR